MNIYRTTILLIATAIIFTLIGCAKFPTTPTTTGKQLVLTLKVRGQIAPQDQFDPKIARHYFIAIDNDANPNTGPLMALYPEYSGTVWVTSQDAQHSIGLTSFIQYDAANPQGNLYGVLPGSYFLNLTSPQPLIIYELLDGGSAIRFIIDFSQIATAAIPADQIRQLNINFITTNAFPDLNELVVPRQIDGLGPSGQDFVNVDTTIDRVYTDTDIDAPNLMLSDPDLDIESWTIEVQTVSSR
ncbi:MAG: hypothetical protein NT018_13665 [Armatimonadetes bacterium]|nr:hypothetical protein [Armatimonadota bacterium]